MFLDYDSINQHKSVRGCGWGAVVLNGSIIPSIEVFIPVLDYPNYSISNVGNVKNIKTGRILNPILRNGYLEVSLCREGYIKIMKIHRLISIHFIPNPDNKLFVDHINSNRLDNRVSNLRWATKSENNVNRVKKANTKSRYIGVTLNNKGDKWKAIIKKDYKNYYLGYFDDEKEAAQAYNDAAIEMFGEYAKLNEISDDE